MCGRRRVLTGSVDGGWTGRGGSSLRALRRSYSTWGSLGRGGGGVGGRAVSAKTLVLKDWRKWVGKMASVKEQRRTGVMRAWARRVSVDGMIWGVREERVCVP